MTKKIIIYSGAFTACFLAGLVMALFGQRYLPSKPDASVRTVPTTTFAAVSTTATSVNVTNETSSALSSTAVSPAPETAMVRPSDQHDAAPTSTIHPASTSAASATTAPDDRTSASEAADGCDIILLIDSSGSMKHTDPQGFRRDAAKLLVSLLTSSDRVGILSFGDAVSRMQPLLSATDENRNVLFNAISRISSREHTTDITEAVKQAVSELETSAKRRGLIILLSDGKIDLGSAEKDAASLAELRNLLPGFARSHIALHTVAFTEQSDSGLLETMARETGGSFRLALEDKDIHQMFAAVVEKIKAPDVIPLDNGAFIVDSEVREATVLATKTPGTTLLLVDPSNSEFSAANHSGNIAWFVSSVFDMITVQAPAVGAWKVKLSSAEGSKVYVITNLSLMTSLDRGFVNRDVATPFEVWLEQKSGGITDKELLENTAFTADLAGPGGVSVKLDLVLSASRPGRLSSSFTCTEAGDYSLRIQARGRTFTRERTITFKAVEPPARQLQPAPAEKPLPPPVRREIPWMTVLFQLAVINVIVLALSAGGYLIWRKVHQGRK